MGASSKSTFAKFREVTGRRKEGSGKSSIQRGAEDRCRLRSFADEVLILTSFPISWMILGKSFYPSPSQSQLWDGADLPTLEGLPGNSTGNMGQGQDTQWLSPAQRSQEYRGCGRAAPPRGRDGPDSPRGGAQGSRGVPCRPPPQPAWPAPPATSPQPPGPSARPSPPAHLALPAPPCPARGARSPPPPALRRLVPHLAASPSSAPRSRQPRARAPKGLRARSRAAQARTRCVSRARRRPLGPRAGPRRVLVAVLRQGPGRMGLSSFPDTWARAVISLSVRRVAGRQRFAGAWCRLIPSRGRWGGAGWYCPAFVFLTFPPLPLLQQRKFEAKGLGPRTASSDRLSSPGLAVLLMD